MKQPSYAPIIIVSSCLLLQNIAMKAFAQTNVTPDPNPPVAASDPRVTYNKAVADYKASRFDDAIAELKSYVKSNPKDGQAYGLLGYLELKNGKDQDALNDLKLASKLNPTDIPAKNNLGNAYLKAGKFPEAVAEFQKVLAKKPFDPIALTNLASAYSQAAQYDDAATEYAKVVKNPHASATDWKNYGFALAKSGKIEDAVAAYKKAISIDPPMNPVFMGQSDYRLVLADDTGVPTAGFRVNRIDFSKKEPCSVNMVDERYMNDEFRFFSEISLFGVGLVSQTIAPSEPKSVADGRTDISARNHFLSHTVPRLPAPGLVNH